MSKPTELKPTNKALHKEQLRKPNGEAPDNVSELVSVMNAQALAADNADLRSRVERLEQGVVALSAGLSNANRLIQQQSQFIGNFVQKVGGSGPTESDG